MNEPIFKYDKRYYFSPYDNCIYGPKKYTKEYYHEYSHFLDHKNKIYQFISEKLSEFSQIKNTTFGLVNIVLLVYIPTLGIQPLLHSFIIQGFLTVPESLFVLQEELRADIRGRIEWGKRQ